jgi:glucosamine-6-phosphate deaminase
MKLIKVKNYNEMSEKALEIIIKDINKKQNLTIAFATGKTPLRTYKNLVEEYNKGKINFSGIKAFNLDEYYTIKKSNKQSFNYYLHKNLLDKINIKKENIFLLNGEAENPEKECNDYENKIKKRKIDLMILGVGVNGHIGFNEPGSKINSTTRLVTLDKETIKRNSGIFRKAPSKALTIGVKTILSSKKIILLACGKEKANAIEHLIKKEATSEYPVSFLRKHKNVFVIIDKEAGSLIS